MCIESFCIGAPFLILLLPSLQRPHFQHRLRRDNASRSGLRRGGEERGRPWDAPRRCHYHGRQRRKGLHQINYTNDNNNESSLHDEICYHLSVGVSDGWWWRRGASLRLTDTPSLLVVCRCLATKDWANSRKEHMMGAGARSRSRQEQQFFSSWLPDSWWLMICLYFFYKWRKKKRGFARKWEISIGKSNKPEAFHLQWWGLSNLTIRNAQRNLKQKIRNKSLN